MPRCVSRPPLLRWTFCQIYHPLRTARAATLSFCFLTSIDQVTYSRCLRNLCSTSGTLRPLHHTILPYQKLANLQLALRFCLYVCSSSQCTRVFAEHDDSNTASGLLQSEYVKLSTSQIRKNSCKIDPSLTNVPVVGIPASALFGYEFFLRSMSLANLTACSLGAVYMICAVGVYV